MSENETGLSRREMNLRVFRREPLPHVFFQPRFEPWYAWHKQFDSLPTSLRGMSLREVYDSIGASMRTVDYYTGQPHPIQRSYTPAIAIHEERGDELIKRRYDTPHGPLTETLEFTVDRTWRTVEFPGKSVDDLPAIRDLVENTIFAFNAANFQVGADYIGERGVPQFWVPKSPYLACAQQLFRFEAFIYAMADRPDDMQAIFDAIDRSYDDLYRQLIDSGRVQIVNYGENVAIAHLSPAYYEQYLLPWYAKRAGQLRAAGIFTHIHIDGFFEPLLPYLRDMPFDGLEALTPLPQGDVSIEQIDAHIGDKILLDGIPAVLFLEHHPCEALQACVEQLVRRFHPRLVLGISDELPQAATEVGFERMRWVSDYARSQRG